MCPAMGHIRSQLTAQGCALIYSFHINAYHYSLEISQLNYFNIRVAESDKSRHKSAIQCCWTTLLM